MSGPVAGPREDSKKNRNKNEVGHQTKSSGSHSNCMFLNCLCFDLLPSSWNLGLAGFVVFSTRD